MTIDYFILYVRPPILTLKAGFGSFQDSTTDYLTTILLKVKLLIQRTFYSSYPRATQGTPPKHNTDNMGKFFVTLFAFAPAPLTNS